MSDDSLSSNPLDVLAEEFVARFPRGERPALTEYTSRHPELADEIRELFPALVMMEEIRPGQPDTTGGLDMSGPRSVAGTRLERLGDYRILREVGRGGMGIVYEAEQESLGRHVALKVLPAHAMLDPRQLQRFQREARSAARLHHTNIVPVFGVGAQDGLHYFVMQFIQGLGLDEVLVELKRLRKVKQSAQNRSGVPRDLTHTVVAGKPSLDHNDPRSRRSGADLSAVKVAQALLTGEFSHEALGAGLPTAPKSQAPDLPTVLEIFGSVSGTVGRPCHSASASAKGVTPDVATSPRPSQTQGVPPTAIPLTPNPSPRSTGARGAGAGRDFLPAPRCGTSIGMTKSYSKVIPEQIAEQRIRKAAKEGYANLDLADLGLKELPASIGQLRQLDHAYVHDNQLTTLPEAFWQLTQLKWLDLSRNQLTTLPEAIGQLTQLQGLILFYNRLTALPETIGNLTQLQKLYLDGNQLTALPDSMRNLKKLERLFLHGNDALGLPLEILGASPSEEVSAQLFVADAQAILAYYFKQRGHGWPLHEIKLLLVGRGEAGKTSIMRRLRENKFNLHQPETPGITIEPWQIRCGPDEIRVHVWDFAGQVITHAAHQFFLTHRSLYVLVLDGRADTQAADAEYWLRLIQAFGTDRDSGDTSPVIVALNKWKKKEFKLDRNAIQEKYPFVRAFVETDCEPDPNGFGIDKLKERIAQTVGEMKGVHDTFPSAWWKIKERLGAMKDELNTDYLTYADYRLECEQLGETDELNQRALAKVLHALGVALNYADDPRLKDATILDPHWVTGGIYTLLRDAARDDGSGEMHLSDVARVLPDEEPKMRRYLVELMRRFDLAFPIGEDDKAWLVPQRLPDNPAGAR